MDLVKIINSSKEFIEANVEGSGFYSLRINLKDGDIKSMYCNCLYDGNCKHLAATLYYLDNHPELLKKEDEINELVLNASIDDIKSFLIQELVINTDLANKFKLFINSDIDEYFYINKLNNSLNNSFDVIKFIDDDLIYLIDSKQYDLIFKLCDILIDYCGELYDYGNYDAFDTILDKLDTLFIHLFEVGIEKEVLNYLGNIILTNDNLDILDLLTDTYSRIGDVGELFNQQ